MCAGCGRLGFEPEALGTDAVTFTPPVVPSFTNGTRLHAQIFSGPESASAAQQIGWHDTTLGTDCQPAVAADGVQRCLPTGATVGDVFGDAACSVALGLVNETGLMC